MSRFKRNVREFRDKAAEEVERDKFPTANGVLHTRAKEKEINHVPQQVPEICMHKHAREVGVPGRFLRDQPEILDEPNFHRVFSVPVKVLEPEEKRQQINGYVDAH